MINTIIIGAGQAGLSISYFLSKKGVEHLVLEKGKIGNEWRDRRWDAFRLITPNHMTRLPGFPYKGDDPEGFDDRNKIIKHLQNYAKFFNAPVSENTKVISLKQVKNGFLIKTSKGDFEAKNVVVAVGSFHKPIIPSLSKLLPKNIFKIHSSEYKNSKQLPKGGVLIVGAGNSGIQIAVDLNRNGKKTFLSIGSVRLVPRNYRGKDFMEWMEIMGSLDRKSEDVTPEIKTRGTLPPLLFGYNENVNFRKLAKDGIQLLGRLSDFKNNKYVFDESFSENLKNGEAALVNFKNVVDKYIVDKKPTIQEEKIGTENLEMPKILQELDSDKIASIIWATGFQDDWAWLKIPILDNNGEPMHTKGVSKIPGLYFMGLRWLSKYKSFLLCGVAEDAEFIANQIK